MEGDLLAHDGDHSAVGVLGRGDVARLDGDHAPRGTGWQFDSIKFIWVIFLVDFLADFRDLF